MIHIFSITKERTEVIFQGTYDDAKDPKAVWEEYEFKCKPGTITRRPCLISPYHYRLDWLLWFAAFQVILRFVLCYSDTLFLFLFLYFLLVAKLTFKGTLLLQFNSFLVNGIKAHFINVLTTQI